MRTRQKAFGVFSLSAIDLFASAMGAFIVITIVLMPYYQKEIRLEGHLARLDALANRSELALDQSGQALDDTRKALQSALAEYRELQAEQDIVSSELETLHATLQTRRNQPPPPPLSPVETNDRRGSNLVTFRFLGIKTDQTRILFMVDMNKYLGDHARLMRDTVVRAMESLKEGYSFGILGFQQLDSGPRYHRWPEDGSLAVMSPTNRARALAFLDGLVSRFAGSSSLTSAFELAFATDAEAFILFSDGLPNPAFNEGLPPGALVQNLTLENADSKEVHAVTIGDYFKYKGTVEFMESLARANGGDFLAVAQ